MSDKSISDHVGKRNLLVVGDKVFKPADDWELSEREKEIARVELGETEEKKERCVRELKKKLENDQNPNYSTEDNFLLRFLRVKKYNVDAAHQMIKENYDLRMKHPDFFELKTKLMDFRNLGVFQYLPYADEEGRTIFWLSAIQWNPKEIPFSELSAYAGKICERVSRNPKSQLNGTMAVWDADGVTIDHLAELLRKNGIYIVVRILQVVFPWRMKKLILLNTGKITRILVKMCYPFISRKIYKRIVLLGSDLSELHQHINQAILPEKLGGFLDNEECKVPKNIIDSIETLD